MAKVMLVIIASWCLAVIPSFAQVHSLRLKLYEGKTWTVRESHGMSAEFPAFPGSEAKATAFYTATYRVDKARENGNLEIVLRLSEGKVDGQSHMFPFLDVDSLSGMDIRMVVQPDGAVREVIQPKELNEESLPDFNFIKEGHINFGFNLFLPNKDVAIGETWKTQKPSLMDTPGGEIEILMNVESRLDELVTIDNQEFLKVTFEGDFTGNLRQGWANIIGKISGSYLFDTERGEVSSMDMLMDQTFTINEEQGVLTGKMKNEMSMERIQDVGVR
jgi:hypothetical protein